MFGLFEFSYDYYEWTSLICVSEDTQKLNDYWASEGEGVPFANTPKEHRDFAKNEERHYMVQPIKCV